MAPKKRFSIHFLFIFFGFFTACKKGENASTNFGSKPELSYAMLPPQEKLPLLPENYIATKKQEIEHFFKKQWQKDFENVSFLVAKNGQIIYEKYDGYADKQNNILNSPEAPLHIASITKVFTASAILKLIDSGKLDLNQKVATILKPFPYPEVTIKTLLNHRSGIKKYGYFTDTIWDKRKILTNKDILNLLNTKNIPLETPTDTHFSYCNTNYVLLALIIEKITAMPYREAMRKIIFEPLGMKNTYVFDDSSPLEKSTPSYKWNYKEYAFDFLDAVYGDKNIYSTPRDLLKFDMARNSPSFLNRNLLQQVYKGYSYESKGIKNYGLGIRLREWETGQTLYYHNGWWHGNTSSYITLPKEKVVIVALSNKFTRKTYQVKKLSALFGDYPFKLQDEVEKE